MPPPPLFVYISISIYICPAHPPPPAEPLPPFCVCFTPLQQQGGKQLLAASPHSPFIPSSPHHTSACISVTVTGVDGMPDGLMIVPRTPNRIPSGNATRSGENVYC